MSSNPSKILIVDDEPEFCEMAAVWLRSEGFAPEISTTPEDALTIVGVDDVDVVLTDLHMDSMTGLEVCQRVHAQHPDVPVIMITAFGSLESAVGAIRAGAYDFVTKPCTKQQFLVSVRRAAERRALHREVRQLRARLEQAKGLDEMLGESPSMRKIYDLVGRVADTETTVLLTGESGTGKELVARALHRYSRRKDKPFVAINCAALPATLLEAELFGHLRGAYTDARQDRRGLFQQASGGTLFLDEIGEMPGEMQAKLLRALQDRSVRPLGGEREEPFDVRLIVATNRDLDSAVDQGRFREDLFYRINVVRLEMPPLRSRGNDVLLLAQAFVGRANARTGKSVLGLSHDAAHRLKEYDWPGNVRELENCIESAVAMSTSDELGLEDLPERIRRFRADDFTVQTTDPAELPSLAEMERRYIFRVLKSVGGNKSAAAKVLGFDRRTLYRKLDGYGSEEAN